VGITFDAPVTTAFICAFGLLYFLYRQRFLLSIACMAALIIMASNFANLVLLGVFVFSFVFYSNRLQKSFILIYLVMLIVFMAKVSPENNEHVGRIFYQVIDKPYDLPLAKVIPIDELKKMPDSVLNFEERRKKYARNYIDSMNSFRTDLAIVTPEKIIAEKIEAGAIKKPRDSAFYVFQESKTVVEKINRYTDFLNRMYSTAEQDSLAKLYNWKKSPGKWIAGEQLFDFFKQHSFKILFGNGIGNFSSRLAFKATVLDMAGQYPGKLKYINPDFLINHLYLYLYFHSQEQSKHEASNTPDAVYFQLAGEYGIAGISLLLFLYFGFFIEHTRKKSFGLPFLLLLAGAFFAEYWFEQFSIVILFELLFFLDMKGLQGEGLKV
jgi:cell division protein FtsW (lipid II flippase)